MATNTIGGCNATRISQLTLDVLQTLPIPFDVFTTNLSNEIAQKGETVTTRVITAPTVISFDGARTSSNSTITAKSVTLGNYVGVKVGFTDKQESLSDVMLAEMFIRPSLTALFENVFANVMAYVTNTNFTTNTTITAANFSVANFTTVVQALNTAKVPLDGRSAIIPVTYATTLKKDSSVLAAYAYGGSDVIKEGRIPKLLGVNMYEYNGTIPNNSENLAAVVLSRQALLLAARAPATPRNWAGSTQNVTDPRTGLTVQYRDWYDASNGEQVTEVCLLYGAGVGVAGNLHRILSA